MTRTEANAFIIWAAGQIRARRQRLRDALAERDPTILAWADRPGLEERLQKAAWNAETGKRDHDPTGCARIPQLHQRPPAYTEAARMYRRMVKGTGR